MKRTIFVSTITNPSNDSKLDHCCYNAFYFALCSFINCSMRRIGKYISRRWNKIYLNFTRFNFSTTSCETGEISSRARHTHSLSDAQMRRSYCYTRENGPDVGSIYVLLTAVIIKPDATVTYSRYRSLRTIPKCNRTQITNTITLYIYILIFTVIYCCCAYLK